VHAFPVAPVAPAAAPAVVAAAPAVVAAAPARGGKCKGRGSGAAPRARKPPAAEVEAATRALQNEGSSAESDNDEGCGDLLQKRAEVKKRRAAQKIFLIQIDTEIEASIGVFVRLIFAFKRLISCDTQTSSIVLVFSTCQKISALNFLIST
jgi:hypothetical protein